MSDRTNRSTELLLLCGKVRDDALTPEDAARLDALLQASNHAKALYVQYMSVLSLLESRGVAEDISAEGPWANEQAGQKVLLELLALEEAAYAPIVEMPKPLHLRVAEEKTPWEFGGALRYVISRPATWTAAAAVLALALILGIVFSSGDQPDNEIAQQPDFTDPIEPGPVGPALSTAVATLTATHNAKWAPQPGGDHRPGALRQGTQLSAGQRLVLTTGLAQITTADGAIAILEAPATIQLINNNALHLHAGKLVGICETESSKGFLVRTPHLDITDLGTRFGVDATQPDATQVHVIAGLVEVASPATDSSGPLRLSARQAIRADSAKVQQIAYTPAPFDNALAIAHLRPRFEGHAVTILHEDFEDATLTYSIDNPERTNLKWDYWVRTDGTNIKVRADHQPGTPPSGTFYFGGNHMRYGGNVPSSQTFSGLDITGLTDIQFSVHVAVSPGVTTGYTEAAAVDFKYQIDGGGYTSMFATSKNASDGGANIGGTALSETFVQFTHDIVGTGSTLDIQITWNLPTFQQSTFIDDVLVTAAPAGEQP